MLDLRKESTGGPSHLGKPPAEVGSGQRSETAPRSSPSILRVPRLGSSPWGTRLERPLVRFLVALAFGDGMYLGRERSRGQSHCHPSPLANSCSFPCHLASSLVPQERSCCSPPPRCSHGSHSVMAAPCLPSPLGWLSCSLSVLSPAPTMLPGTSLVLDEYSMTSNIDLGRCSRSSLALGRI